MKSAIVIGGNGLVGRALVTQLARLQIPTVVLGTSEKIHPDLDELHINDKIDYVKVPFGSGIHELLELEIREKRCFFENSVFFNLAWRGREKLVDGDISDQLKNVELSCELVKLAKKLNSEKYVVAGSMEETIFERFVNSKSWLLSDKKNDFNWYALAKVAARMQSSFEAYNKKLNICFTRISIVIDKKLSTPKFVEQSLKKLLKSPEIPSTENKELCNLSSSEEIARQLTAIGEKGINKHIYILGSEESATLYQYFTQFALMRHGEARFLSSKDSDVHIGLLTKDDFVISNLIEDTGYKPKENSEKLFQEIIKQS